MAGMTRGEFANKLVKLLGYSADSKGYVGGFADTAGNTYYDNSTSILKELGITTGTSSGNFSPQEPITRAQAVTMLARAFKIPGVATGSFSDVAGSTYYAKFVNAFQELGVVGVNTDGKFNPNDILDPNHLDLMMSRLATAGYTADKAIQSTPASGEADEEEEEEEDGEEAEAMSDDYLERTRTMLREFGITITSDVDKFITKSWTEGWTAADIQLEMYSEEFFKERFPAIEARQKAGLGKPLTAQEYVALESAYRETLRRAGFPPSFYDSPEDFETWMVADRSPLEIQQDIAEQFAKVDKAPQEIKDYFTAAFGITGAESALAAWFINPDKTEKIIEEAVGTAEMGGTAARFNFGLDQDRALRMHKLGIDIRRAEAGFAQLVELTPLFEETVGERFDEDMDAMDEGLDVAFNIDDGQASREVQKRLRTRLARFQGDSAAAATEQGMFGLGVAT